jgi:hypothetical protein
MASSTQRALFQAHSPSQRSAPTRFRAMNLGDTHRGFPGGLMALNPFGGLDAIPPGSVPVRKLNSCRRRGLLDDGKGCCVRLSFSKLADGHKANPRDGALGGYRDVVLVMYGSFGVRFGLVLALGSLPWSARLGIVFIFFAHSAFRRARRMNQHIASALTSVRCRAGHRLTG